MRTLLKMALLLLLPANLLGQSVDATVGGSQILGLAGIQANYEYRGNFGWTGIGYYNGGFQIASYSDVPLRFTPQSSVNQYRLGVGDQELNTWLTTDEYELYKASTRGASVYRHSKDSDIQAFVGSYSVEDRQPFLRAASQFSSPTGALVGHFHLSNKWELQSFNTFGDAITSIQSFAWRHSAWRLGTAGGIGSNHPYLANVAEFRKGDLNLRASYTLASNQFHRQESVMTSNP